MNQCEYYSDGFCRAGQYNGKPTEDDCAVCSHYRGPSRGMGDKIAKVLETTKIDKAVKSVLKDCGCGKRRAALNKIFPKGSTDA